MDGGRRCTDRLRLEPLGIEHADALWQMHQDAGVVEWFGPWSRERVDERCREASLAWHTKGVDKWLAYDRETGEVVGRGGASFAVVEGREQLEVGWVLRDRYRAHGFATEMGRAGLSYCFDELDAEVVVAFTEPANLASRAVMERLGMLYEREIEHDGMPMVLYAISAGGVSSSG